MTSTGRATYQLHVVGHLDDRWVDRFGELVITRLDDGTCTLTGPVVDQAALHGILARLRDIGVTLLSLRRLDGPDATRFSAAPADRARDRVVPQHGGW